MYKRLRSAGESVCPTLIAIVLFAIAADAQQRSKLRIGQALYRDNCVVCHEIDKPQSTKLGPDFYQLFKRDKMPLSSMKPNRDYIKVRVKFGGQLMPAFRQWLSDAEIDTLIDYIQSK
jgi:mono/diheme cytochrome c family protein